MHSSLPAANAAALAGRIAGIDAARGIAMILVCLSHVRIHFSDVAPELYSLVTDLTRLATPSFLLLSGFVAAHVLSGPSERSARATLVDRGLFLLLVAHVLIGLDELRSLTVTEWLFGRVLVTDAIGVCLIMAVFMHRLSPRTLFVLGAAAVVLSWPFAMTLQFDSPAAQRAGAALLTLRSAADPHANGALIPYLGMFLIGMGLRKWTTDQVRSGDATALARRLAMVGAAAVGLVALGIALWYLAKPYITAQWSGEAVYFVRATLNPGSKLPPSPAYVLGYGGGGLLIAAACLFCRPRRILQPLVERSAVIGRASLLCFIVQDWLLRLTPVVLGLDRITSPAFWLLYFAAAVLALYWISRQWLAIRGNRFLTLGIRTLAARRSQSAAVKSAERSHNPPARA